MVRSRVAGRYAKSVIELAREQGELDVVVEDFKTLREAVRDSKDLQNLLASPIIDVRVKERILTEIFKGKLSPLVDRFMILMTKKGRASELFEITQAFQDHLDVQMNVITAVVTTAVELGADERARIEAELKRLSGHDIRADYKVDPSIIGGFRAMFQDRMIDASVRRQLDRLRESLAGTDAANN
jgi:F-type H+-transporting ATPase subunit delta